MPETKKKDKIKGDANIKRKNPPPDFFTIQSILNEIWDYESIESRFHLSEIARKNEIFGETTEQNKDELIEFLPSFSSKEEFNKKFKFIRINEVKFFALKRHFRSLIIFLHWSGIYNFGSNFENWFINNQNILARIKQAEGEDNESREHLANSQKELKSICNDFFNVKEQRFIEFYPITATKNRFLTTTNSNSSYTLDLHNLIASDVDDPSLNYDKILSEAENKNISEMDLFRLNFIIDNIEFEINKIRSNWALSIRNELKNGNLIGWAYDANGINGSKIMHALWQSDYTINYKGELIIANNSAALPRICLHVYANEEKMNYQ